MYIYQPFESSNNDPRIVPPVSPLIQVNSTQIINIASISRGLINSVNPNDHQAKNIRLTLTPQAIRLNKFDFVTGKFDQGYPFNDVYYFCDQNLTSIYKYASKEYTKNLLTGNIRVVHGQNTYELCGNGIGSCNTACASGSYLDPSSCLCIVPPLCVPQPNDCEPAIIPPNLKPTIYGYAFYLDEPRSVYIPNIGYIEATCGGGHYCCATVFTPTIKTSTNNYIYANRNISMNNVSGPRISLCEDNPSQINVENFMPQSNYEKSDSFEFNIANPSQLIDANFYLDCALTSCHTGVTFVVLVGETIDGEYSVLFSSCVTPNEVDAKSIGTIDCDNESEPILCTFFTPLPSPPPPSPTPTFPTPTPTPIPPTLYLQLGGCLPNQAFLEGRPQLASFMNTLFDSTRLLPLNIYENGTFSATEGDTLMLDGDLITYQVHVGGDTEVPPGFIYITILIAGQININGTTTIISMQWQQSLENNTDPYSTIPILNTNYLGAGGWMSLAFYGCTNWDVVVNP
jgi:hypothetical protein